MDRKTLNNYLYNYYNLKDLIEEKKNKIDEIKFIKSSLIESFAMPAAIVNDGMPHSHNASSDGLINNIIRKDEQLEKFDKQIERLQQDILKYTQIYAIITDVFNNLKADEKQVFIRSYKNHENRIDICYFMGYKTVRTIAIKRDNICKQLEKKLIENGLEG